MENEPAFDPADLAQLGALSLLTERTSGDLFHTAIERLRHELVPSTRPAAAKSKPGPKAKS